jgi:hypothetical protein
VNDSEEIDSDEEEEDIGGAGGGLGAGEEPGLQ